MADGSGSRAKRLLRTIATIVIVGAVVAFFAVTLIENWADVSRSQLVPDWSWALALVLFAAAVPVSGVLWGAIVGRMAPNHPPTARDAAAVHITSWLLKYIPGQVGSVVNKVLWGSKNGYPRLLILVSFLYENVFLQVASLVPSVLIIAIALGENVFLENPATLALPLLVILPLLLILVPRILRAALGVASRRVMKSTLPREYVLPGASSLGFSVAYIAPRVVNGIGFVALAASIAPLAPDAWLVYAAAYTLAGAIGILAVFVPSGIGVREGVLFAVLVAAGAAPADAVLLAVVARLLSTLSDAVLGIAWAALRFFPRKDSTRD